MRIVLFVLAVLSTSFAHAQQVATATDTASIQQPAQVERPVFKVGDSCTYQLVNNWNNTVKDKYTLTTSTVSDKEITIGLVSLVSGTTDSITMTPDFGVISMDGAQYTPDSGIGYAFPLTVGKTWKTKGNFTKSDRSGSYATIARVVGWEKVKVPAGEFTALKVTYDGSYHVAMKGGYREGAGTEQTIRWYVPSLGCSVKITYESTDWYGRPYDKNTKELVAYHVN